MGWIKLVIFDLDDCLIDTWGASFPITIEKAINAMVRKGLEVNSIERAIERLVEINDKSSNSPEAITKYLIEINADPLKYLEIGKRAIYDFNFEDRIKTMQGVPEMLEKLSRLEIDLAIVTRGGEERQMKKMEIAGINQSIFKKIYAVLDYDKTEPYKKIIKELNHSANKTLIVGDRYKTDLIPGKNLGAKVAWVSWGRGKISPPKNEEVNYVIKDFSEIEKILQD